MDAAAELGRNPVTKHHIQLEYGGEQADTGRDCRTRQTKFSGTNADREIFIFPVQRTTSRIGNHTRLIHTLMYVMIIHTYYSTVFVLKITPPGSLLNTSSKTAPPRKDQHRGGHTLCRSPKLVASLSRCLS